MEPVQEATKCYDQMFIVEKYEKVISYLYPIAQSIPRQHGVARDKFLDCLLGQVNLFIVAGKSNQVSKLYAADAGLATLALIREMLPHDGLGLPIGSLLSKVLANLYAQPIDRLVHYGFGQPTWARYMDDIVVLGNDPAQLRDIYQGIKTTAADRLGLRISRWQVALVSKGINFLGYRIWPDHKLLRKNSVLRAKRKVGKFIEHTNTEGLRKFLSAWTGHAQWADSHNLISWMENHYGIACH